MDLLQEIYLSTTEKDWTDVAGKDTSLLSIIITEA